MSGICQMSVKKYEGLMKVMYRYHNFVLSALTLSSSTNRYSRSPGRINPYRSRASRSIVAESFCSESTRARSRAISACAESSRACSVARSVRSRRSSSSEYSPPKSAK